MVRLPLVLAACASILAAQPSAESQAIFEFHSVFWVNLHHFLYQQAIDHRAKQPIDNDRLNPAEQKLWTASVAYYEEQFAAKDLLSRDMEAIKNALEDHEGSLTGSGLPPELMTLLQVAAPVYRTYWWPEHHRKNTDWIAQMTPLVAKYGTRIRDGLAAAYRTAWPDSPIRVDVTSTANWSGAYTTLEPTRITISSSDARDQGTDGLEILFHEASHGIVRRLQETVSQATQAQSKRLPRRDLWHAMLFYTTGEIVRRNVPDHVPYAIKNGLWERGWPGHLPVFQKDWLPYLNGETGFESAVARVVVDL